ncbi:hypothetical protein [Micavibrio aeruginosavorus]|uniref:hypothetical protein n=1 Tax=Micavibrio aeruginosavorus TaxID=349221 RepID=UPI003F4A9165
MAAKLTGRTFVYLTTHFNDTANSHGDFDPVTEMTVQLSQNISTKELFRIMRADKRVAWYQTHEAKSVTFDGVECTSGPVNFSAKTHFGYVKANRDMMVCQKGGDVPFMQLYPNANPDDMNIFNGAGMVHVAQANDVVFDRATGAQVWPKP